VGCNGTHCGGVVNKASSEPLKEVDSIHRKGITAMSIKNVRPK
jgi:hypothetical protein